MTKLLDGRLVTVGDGRLFMQPVNGDGEHEHILSADEEVHPDAVEVRWDEAAGGFTPVGRGGSSHHDTHHMQFVTINGTHGDLYDDKGVLVVPADPHHYEPMATDPNYDPTAPHKTRAQFHEDHVGPTATGHTSVRS